MQSRFIDLKLTSGERLILNTTYISQITATYDDDFSNGVDVVFLALGEPGLLQASVPASQVGDLLNIVSDPTSPFLDIKAIGGQRLILNKEYITHITPTHGTNLSDGADVSVWGTVVQVPASGVGAIAKLVQSAA